MGNTDRLIDLSKKINRPSVTIVAVIIGVWLGYMQFPFVEYLKPVGDVFIALLQVCVLPFLMATIPLAVRSALETEEVVWAAAVSGAPASRNRASDAVSSLFMTWSSASTCGRMCCTLHDKSSWRVRGSNRLTVRLAAADCLLVNAFSSAKAAQALAMKPGLSKPRARLP